MEYLGAKLLVTGATGFVGQRLVADLTAAGAVVITLARSGAMVNADLSVKPDLSASLQGCDAVIHLASRVHVMKDAAADPLSEYRLHNVESTRHLAQSALSAGVPRFVYLSSIKVNGEATNGGAYTEKDLPAPQDPYGVSKLEAELVLRDLERTNSSWSLVILRPPLVYGPGVKANFAALIRLIDKVPALPFGSFSRKRSLIFVGNLSSAILAALKSDIRGTFVVSDGNAVSVRQLTLKIASALRKKIWIIPIPVFLLRGLAAIVGKSAQVSRLVDPLEVDGSGFENAAGWKPPFTLEEGLAMTTRARADK